MTPLRIPSPAPDSPEYTCQGSRESSFSGDEGCPPCELGGGDVLHVSSRGVIPGTLEEGVTSHGLGGAPPPYPLAARPEDRSPKKLRIKLKSSRPETTTLCAVDAAGTLGPLPGRGEVALSELSNNESPLKSFMRPAGACPNKKLIEIATSKVHEGKDRWCWAYGPAFPYQNTLWRTSLPELPQKKVLKKALSEAENHLVQVFYQRLKERRLWDVNMKPSLSSLQWAGIVSGFPDLSCPELELSSASFLSIRGGGSDRFHGPDDDDVRSYVGFEEAGLRTPPLQDLTEIPSLDETGMTKGRRLQLPSGAFAHKGRGRRRAGGRGHPDSPDRAKIVTEGVLAMPRTMLPSLLLMN
ncbi:hypothetical protein Dimus_003494 [Dionaea muscipula]